MAHKKSGATAHPSTSKAPSHAATDIASVAAALGDTGAIGDATNAGGTIIVPSAAEAGTKNAGEGQHRQHPDGRVPHGAGGRMSSLHLPTALVGIAPMPMPALV